MTKNAKIVWQQKKVPPAIIPEKAIILHTLEDAGIAPCTSDPRPWALTAKVRHLESV